MRDIDGNREIFTKVWNIYKSYGEPRTDEEWDLLIGKMSELYKQFMNVAKKQVSMGIYAVEKEGVCELKNERYTDIADLKRVVSDYEGCGFKVYYNELPKIPKMEKGGNADNGIFAC